MLQAVLSKIRQDGNLKDLLRYSSVMYASGIFSSILITVQQITTARLIGPEDYGRYAALVGVSAFAILIADVRTWELGAKLLVRPILDNDYPEISRITTWLLLADLLTGLLCLVVILALAQPIATYLLHAPDLYWIVDLFVLYLPLRMLANGIGRTLMRMYNQYNWLSIKSIVYGIARIVFISGGAFLGYGLPGVVIGTVLAEMVGATIILVMAWAVHRQHVPNTSFIDFHRPKQFREGLRMMRGLWLSATLWGLEIEVYFPLLALFTTPEQVGIFRSGLDIAETIEKLLIPFMLVLFPQIMKSYEQDSRPAFLRLIKQSALLMGGLTVPFMLAIFFAGPILLPQFLGSEFNGVAIVASLIASGYTVYGILMWTRPVLVSLSHVRELNLIGIFTIVLSIVALLGFVPAYGAVAAAGIRGLTMMLKNLLSYGVFRYLIVRHKLPQEAKLQPVPAQ